MASALANVSNLLVCNLLVRGDDFLASVGVRRLGLPQLGALGAGAAFSIASGILAWVVMAASNKYRPSSSSLAVSARTVMRLGAPVGLQLLAEIGVFSLCTVLVARFGSAAVSAHQVALGLGKAIIAHQTCG